ncbi:MAG: hypothetical protein H6981_01270 [Gammaproteobacteria bacterium]|nr:hypothetical protein [Gammaproteobacteria bacterium]MCP5135416.1 hypothetical protein [Gammaproteobacteria bacterium]
MIRSPVVVVFVTLVACSSAALAASGRYTVTAPVPNASQRDILSVVTETRFNTGVQTVGDAIRSLLEPSGYVLSDAGADPALPILMDLPLPAIHRRLGPIRLDQALATLAGDAWRPVFDPVHRWVSFELRPEFRFNPVASGNPPPSAPEVFADAPVAAPLSPASPAAMPDSVSDAATGAQSFSESAPPPLPRNAQLSDLVSPDFRGLPLQIALEAILPGWRVDLFLLDPTRAESTVDLTGENTLVENVLEQIAERFGLTIYPYADRVPPILVVTDEQS